MYYYIFFVGPIFGLIGILISKNNNRSGLVGFLVGYLFGPIGFIILMFLGKRTENGINSIDSCENCGEKLNPTDKFCGNCGTKVLHS